MFTMRVSRPKEPRLHRRIRKMLRRRGVLQTKRDPWTGRRARKHKRASVFRIGR